MTEVEKSFERIQRRRMPLHLVAEAWGGGYDLRDTELCVFYFGDGQFVLRPKTVRTGDLEQECTAIPHGGSILSGVGRHRNNQRLFIWSD